MAEEPLLDSTDRLAWSTRSCRFSPLPSSSDLSMDYEVFLVARVLEERRRGLSERSAVIEGVARTAGLITSAAAIMIAVFTAFTVGSFLVVQMLGFTLAVAVFIDATAVRMVVRAGTIATCRRLELVALWFIWGHGDA